jgi:hypothetical protein
MHHSNKHITAPFFSVLAAVFLLRFIVAIVVFAAIVVVTYITIMEEFTGDIGLGQVVRGRVCLGRLPLNVLER